jgi:competence protein ComEC
VLKASPTWVQIQVADQRWLWLKDVPQKFWSVSALREHQVLWWSGKPIAPAILDAIHPQVAIAYSAKLDADTRAYLETLKTQVYPMAQVGAIQWTPTTGFSTTVEPSFAAGSRL